MNSSPTLNGAEIKNGLEQDEFFLLYQPRFDIYLQRITSVEALVRWRHPRHGIISPLQFIDLAERNGLIERLGDLVLSEACAAAASWRKMNLEIDISVNVSPLQLTPYFPGRVQTLLTKHRLPPAKLELEVTEGVLLSQKMRQVISQVMAQGVGIAIDDFGTGHSSLAYLRQFEARTLKVDGSFLNDVPGDLNGCMLLNSIIKLGHSLGMAVVCEGVENQEQMELVELAQADQIQGYIIARPLPENEMVSRFCWDPVDVSTGCVTLPKSAD